MLRSTVQYKRAAVISRTSSSCIPLGDNSKREENRAEHSSTCLPFPSIRVACRLLTIPDGAERSQRAVAFGERSDSTRAHPKRRNAILNVRYSTRCGRRRTQFGGIPAGTGAGGSIEEPRRRLQESLTHFSRSIRSAGGSVSASSCIGALAVPNMQSSYRGANMPSRAPVSITRINTNYRQRRAATRVAAAAARRLLPS